MEIIVLFLVVGSIIVFIAWVSGSVADEARLSDIEKLRRSAKAARPRARRIVLDSNAPRAKVEKYGSRGFGTEVVGESRYQDALEDAAGGRTGNDVREEVDVVAEPEPENRADPEAVVIKVDGETVGYLPRGNTAAFHSKYSGPVECRGLIVGGGKTDSGREKSFGIWINLEL